MALKSDSDRPQDDGELAQWILGPLPMLIAVVAGPDYRYRFANHEVRSALFGGREFIGQAVSDLFPTKTADRTLAILDQVHKTGERVVGAESSGVVHNDRLYNLIYEFLRQRPGLTAASIKGRSLAELLPDPALASTAALRRVIEAGQPCQHELSRETPSRPGARPGSSRSKTTATASRSQTTRASSACSRRWPRRPARRTSPAAQASASRW